MSSEYKRVRDYELMVVFHPELSEEDLLTQVTKIEEHVTSAEGTIRLVNRELPWGRRRLAYPIRHGSRDVRDGVYVLYYFSSESGKIEEIEREIKLDDRILRYLLTQQSAPIMEPAVVEEEEGAAVESEEPASEEPSTEAPTRAKRASRASADTEVAESTEGSPESDATDAADGSSEPEASETSAEPEVIEASVEPEAAEPEPEVVTSVEAPAETGIDELAQSVTDAESKDETPE